MNKGVITQITGVVVDVRFEENLPEVYSALEIEHLGKKLILEVQQHLGLREVRAVAMGSTDGLSRGQEVLNTGAPISVPVGPKTLGRMFDVVGNPIDGKEALSSEKTYPIHRPAPTL